MPVLVTVPARKPPDKTLLVPFVGVTTHCKSRRKNVTAWSSGVAASTAAVVTSRRCSAVNSTALIATSTMAATPMERIISTSVNALRLFVSIFTVSNSGWSSRSGWPACPASPRNLCPARKISLPTSAPAASHPAASPGSSASSGTPARLPVTVPLWRPPFQFVVTRLSFKTRSAMRAAAPFARRPRPPGSPRAWPRSPPESRWPETAARPSPRPA
jgi:hypothetical protein